MRNLHYRVLLLYQLLLHQLHHEVPELHLIHLPIPILVIRLNDLLHLQSVHVDVRRLQGLVQGHLVQEVGLAPGQLVEEVVDLVLHLLDGVVVDGGLLPLEDTFLAAFQVHEHLAYGQVACAVAVDGVKDLPDAFLGQLGDEVLLHEDIDELSLGDGAVAIDVHLVEALEDVDLLLLEECVDLREVGFDLVGQLLKSGLDILP